MLVSMLPVSCHCQVVPGLGFQTVPLSAAGEPASPVRPPLPAAGAFVPARPPLAPPLAARPPAPATLLVLPLAPAPELELAVAVMPAVLVTVFGLGFPWPAAAAAL